MKIYCPECGALVAAADISLENGLAKCRQCQAVFSYAGAARQEGQRRRQPPGGTPPGTPAPLLARPERMVVEDFAGTWAISWRWFTFVYVFLVFFCVVWNCFLFVWYGLAMGDRRAPFLMLVFPLGHIAVGAGLTYFTVCGFVNRTRISIDSTELVVKHGPLPWPGGGRFKRADLEQVFCEQGMQHTKNGVVSFSYNLMAMLRDGSKRKLVSGLSNASETQFLEQQIERKLGIVDQPVVGEFEA